jgi:RNA polymerase sigma-70 factor (ECF subfamily)
MSEHPSFDVVMAELRAGVDSAAAQIFERFAQRLIALARSRLDARLRAKVDPEDVVQSVYKSFFLRHADGRLDPGDWDGLWALLTVITLRKCGCWREKFHTASRDMEKEVPLPSAGSASSSGWETVDRDPTPAEAAMLAETVALVLHDLEGRDRDIATLALQGYTATEISAQLGRPERTVYRVLGRIKKQLQRWREAALD